MTSRRRDVLATLTEGTLSATLLAVLLVGPPVALWRLVGWPLPTEMPSWAEVTGALGGDSIPAVVLFKALALACWVWWLLTVLGSIVVETEAVVVGRPARRVPLAGPVQLAVAHLVTTVALVPTLVRDAPARSPERPLSAVVLVTDERPKEPSDPRLTATSVVAGPVLATECRSEDDDSIAATDEAGAVRYVVRPDDNPWHIAEHHYGDGEAWRLIWAYPPNRERVQPDGRRWVEQHLIRPGWVLYLPPGAPPPNVNGQGGDPVLLGDTSPSASAPVVVSPGEPPAVSFDGQPADDVEAEPTASGSHAPPAGDTPEESTPVSSRARPSASVALPSGSVIGASFATGFLSALVLVRLRRRRGYEPAPPLPGIRRRVDSGSETARSVARLGAAIDKAGLDGTEAEDGSPSSLAVGVRDGAEVAVDLLSLSPVVLAGDGADDVLRALVASLLARKPPAQVVATVDVLARLLPGVTPFPGLTSAPTVDAVLTEAEVALVGRARLLEKEEAGDVHDHWRDHADDPMPLMVMVVSGEDATGGRLGAIVELGRRLGVAVVARGESEMAGTARIEVGRDHLVTADPPALADQLRNVGLFQIRPEEAAELLGMLAAARCDPVPEVEPGKEEPFVVPADSGATDVRVGVCLLGPYSISVDGEEVVTGWRDKARELLAFFVLHPEGATIDAAVEALWPEAAPGRGSEWFWTNLSNVRTQLRSATGRQELKVLTKAADRYRVEPDLFDVDLWRFQSALGAVEAAGDDRVALRVALEDAASAYGGDLLSGSDYDWPEDEREDLHRRALNTLARLATVRLDAEDDEGALAVLQRALDLDPHAEAIYRQVMAIEADLGRPDAARRTFRRLEARMAELDLEPDGRTKALLDRIVRHAADPPHRSGAGPAAAG